MLLELHLIPLFHQCSENCSHDHRCQRLFMCMVIKHYVKYISYMSFFTLTIVRFGINQIRYISRRIPTVFVKSLLWDPCIDKKCGDWLGQDPGGTEVDSIVNFLGWFNLHQIQELTEILDCLYKIVSVWFFKHCAYCWYCTISAWLVGSSQSHHNERDSVSNHRRHDCLLRWIPRTKGQ